jgi:hypothetical protein
VAYTINAPKSQKAAMESKVADLKSDSSSLKTKMVTELKAAGADAAVADSLAVTSFAGAAEIETYTPSTTQKPTQAPQQQQASCVTTRADLRTEAVAGRGQYPGLPDQ